MGIRGLSSYIQARASKYLQDHQLQNTTVVIDGNNLACAAYSDCPRLNPCFGGDYNLYYNYVKDFFLQLKRCKIKPLIIFDGGLDIGNRKHRQRILRAKAKVIASVKVKPSNQHRMRVLPLFFKTVFLDLLKELKIEVIQCQYEADQEIAALARGLNCPVISNDSDFYVVNVALIPLSSLEFGSTFKNANGPAIKCKIFEMDKLLTSIGYEDPSIFPLLGTLLGNDYADARKFENIYSHISIPKSKSMCDQHRRIAGLLEFLRDESVEGAIDKILTYVKKINRTDVEVAIRTSLKAYADETNNQVLDFESLRNRIVSEMIEDGCPDWFANAYCRSEIQSWVVELMFCRRIPFHSQVESPQMSYTFLCPRDILKAIGLICLPSDDRNSILALSRKQSQLVFKRVAVSPNDYSFPLPKLPSVITLSVQDRRQLFFDVLLDQNCGQVTNLPEKWWLVGSAIIYWVRHSLCTVRTFHVDALICSLIHLVEVEPRVGRFRSLKRLENVRKTKSAEDATLDYLTAVKSTFSFNEVNERMMTHDIGYDRDLVHTFSEFQAVLYYTQVLGSVLATELGSPNPGTFYNGTFLYHAAVEFRSNRDRSKVAGRIYGPKSTLLQEFQQFTEVILDASPSSLGDWTSRRDSSQPRKRTKKPKEKVDRVVEESSSSNEISVDEDEPIDDALLMSNRFLTARDSSNSVDSQILHSSVLQDAVMLIKEFRIPMPLTVEEYQVAQAYSFAMEALNNTGGGDGVEVVRSEFFTNVPLLDGRPSSGQYTHKIYHMNSKVPSFIQALMPKGTLEFHEESWNAYPYFKTVYTNPKFMKENFLVTIESIHCPGDDYAFENPLHLSEAKLQQREVIHIDIANDRISSGDYREDEDPSKFQSLKSNRGPLVGQWTPQCKPLMTCYKLVAAEFKWFGLQSRVESYILNTERRIFTVFHRKIFCWIDQWYGLSMEDVYKLEKRIKDELDNQRDRGELCGYVA